MAAQAMVQAVDALIQVGLQVWGVVRRSGGLSQSDSQGPSRPGGKSIEIVTKGIPLSSRRACTLLLSLLSSHEGDHQGKSSRIGRADQFGAVLLLDYRRTCAAPTRAGQMPWLYWPYFVRMAGIHTPDGQ